MPQFQPVQFGKYLLQERVATGGMAEVFKAKKSGEHGFEKTLIIKTLFPHLQTEKELVTSFVEEAKLAAGLQHPNVVQIYDFGKVEETYFIAMEYLAGINLRRILDATDTLPLSLENALFITQQICAGLNYAHNKTDADGNPIQLIHRDVSPPNILITNEGQLKVIDFGIAKAASQNTSTQLGIIKGKVAYMSPEQAQGKEIDHRSDVFSIGILLYEMVCGQKVYEGETAEILAKAREGSFKPADRVKPDLPDPVLDILNRALQKNINSRYQSSAEMMSDVEECILILALRPANHRLAEYIAQVRQLQENETAVEPELPEKKSVEPDPQDEAEDVNEYDATLEIQIQGKPSGPLKKIVWLFFALMVAVLVALAPSLLDNGSPKIAGDGSPGKEEPVKVKTKSRDIIKTKRKTESATVQPVPKKAPAPQEETKPEEKVISQPVPEKRSFAILMEEANDSLELKFYSEAEQQFNTLLEAYPERREEVIPFYSKAMLGKASVLGQKKEYDQAKAVYANIIELDGQCVDAVFNLGYIYAVQKDYQNAETMYQRAVDLNPPYLDEALFNLAVVQDKLGKKEVVALNLIRALTINPKNRRVEKYLEQFKKRNGSK